MTDSAVSDQNRNNVLCCLDGVWTVSCGTGMIWSENPPSPDSFIGRDYHVKRFSNGCLPSASVHCLISVGSHSGESGRCRDRFGRFLPCERYKSDQNRIENGIIGTNSAGNG